MICLIHPLCIKQGKRTMFIGNIINRGKWALATVLLGHCMVTNAQNPIISGQYTADPTARVFGDSIYLYPSHDIPSPIERLKEWFCMADYHVFSSYDLTHWNDHGVIVTQNKVPWVSRDSYSMWAPDCVERTLSDGSKKYFFFFPAMPKGELKSYAVGVAVSDSPTGPFTPLAEPIKDLWGIDPCVLLDDDGKAYIYNVGTNCLQGTPLKDNLTEKADSTRKMEGLPDGFKEGPFAFKKDGRYYLTFPWVRKENGTETLAYAMSDKPLGPWTFKGVIMDESPTGCWTNHHSIVQYRGQWYLFYHHNDYSPKFDKLRSVRIDSLFFNPDGTIQKVTPTLRGVGITEAASKVQLDRYSDIINAHIAYLDENKPFEGWKTILEGQGSVVKYNRVDFGDKPFNEVVCRVKASAPCTLNILADGKTISSVRVRPSAAWTEVTAKVKSSPKGINDLSATLAKGKDLEIDWISFK